MKDQQLIQANCETIVSSVFRTAVAAFRSAHPQLSERIKKSTTKGLQSFSNLLDAMFSIHLDRLEIENRERHIKEELERIERIAKSMGVDPDILKSMVEDHIKELN